MAELVHLPPDAKPEEVSAVLARDACVVVDRLAREALERVRDEMALFVEATPPGGDDFSGRRTRRTGGLVARSPAAREIVVHPTVVGAVGELLSDATSFHLHLTQIISIGPGQAAQPVHRDQWAFDFFPFPQGYEVQCNTIWAMTDFSEENGATRVAPGSHRLADKLQLAEEDTVPAEMEAGSVLFYTGALYHGGGANRSRAERIGLNLTYARGWLRQEENQYLTVPCELARELPVDLLRMIGYQRGAYALGYVDDLRDPLEVVRPDLARSGLGDAERMREKLRSEGFEVPEDAG